MVLYCSNRCSMMVLSCQVKCLLNGLTIFLISTGIRALVALIWSVEHFRAASLSRSAKECPCLHRLQLGTPVHIDNIQSLNTTTEIHWDPGYLAMCFCHLVHCTAWFLPSPSRHVGFLSRLPGVSVSFEELTEAETPCRVTSWPWLIWLIGHYRIYRYL